MASISLQGNLSHSLENAFTAVTPDDRIDVSKDGTQLLGKDGTDVSYFAEVKNQNVTEFFCTDASGVRIPSFMLTGHVGPAAVCYVCFVDASGQKVGCMKVPCNLM